MAVQSSHAADERVSRAVSKGISGTRRNPGAKHPRLVEVVSMETTIVSLKLNGADVVTALQAAAEKLERMKGDMILDFSTVRRLDPAALSAMSDFADAADERPVNIILRGVNVDVYRVLKLARLTQRFSMVS